ncbi:MAG: phage portal protein [Lawsonibacter sp.]|nr:phage portal protein [Lawsonibacter sp.]
MKWWKQKRREPPVPVVQVRSVQGQPFGALDRYVPLRPGELPLYRAIREGVPIVDAAIWKLVRLCGGVSARARDSAAQAGLERFLKTVDTGWGQRGIQSFLDRYLDDLFTCGRGLGEIVLDGEGRDIAALLCADPEQVEVKVGDSPMDFRLCLRRAGAPEELPWQALLLFTPFQPTGDAPYGVSLLQSMPFLAGILMKIFQATGQNWERAGNLRFAVVCRPGQDEEAFAQERCRQIAGEWSAAMQAGREGVVRDFVAVGDVDIKVIGADSPVLDCEVPVRQILEQLVARTGIPPFMLGLSWSSTERMSTQQADLLTSEITAIRRSVEPVLRRVCELWLELHGFEGQAEILWEDINLQDVVEEARAALYMAQARRLSGSARTDEADQAEEDKT